MKQIRLGSACINTTPLNWETHLQLLLATISEAQNTEVGVLCLPELCISGYGCEDAFFAKGVQQTSQELLAEIVPHTQGIATLLGLPLCVEGQLYNTMAFVCDATLLGFVAKQHLADDGIHYEPRWFQPWPSGEVREVTIEDKTYPVGDLLFDCGGIKIGIEICRDAWVKNRTGCQLAARGADILLNPSASHFAFAKQEMRRKLAIEASQRFHVSYAHANLLGNESGRAIFDGSCLIASRGSMLAEGPRLSFNDYLLTAADVDITATRRDREKDADQTSLTMPPSQGILIKSPFSFSVPRSACPAALTEPWDTSPPPKAEEFARSVPLALFDYLRKSHARGMVVSLSGGADSSSVVAMVWLMVEFGIANLGREAFLSKLSPIEDLQQLKDPKSLVHRLLTCVYQSTRNSGDVTRHAAQTVAQAVGAEFFEWNIDAAIDGYVNTVSQAVGRELTWDKDDLSLQNIQARARGPGAWLLANLRGALLLATSNRSEAAVGYATMDGDTCGGLAPIAGIDKAFLRAWLCWMEKTGPHGIGPLPALSVVNAQVPTAELRPPEESQTDESDLMPYDVLDAIERAAIRDKLMPWEVLQAIQPIFCQYDIQQLGDWVERFFQLWCRNQWKRERYAPSFHLDDENLDPKTWCRFPILSGGFQRELETMRKAMENE